MGYTNYDFYKNEFHGDFVDESSFDKWESRAEDKLRYICGSNLTEETETVYATEIAKATCSLIDILYQIDYATRNATDSTKGNVKSMSSGGQSVTFSSSETLVTVVLSDKKSQDKLMYDIVSEYLHGTGLLYMGV